MTHSEDVDAFRLGRIAGLHNAPLETNPYLVPQWCHCMWVMGWIQGYETFKKNKWARIRTRIAYTAYTVSTSLIIGLVLTITYFHYAK